MSFKDFFYFQKSDRQVVVVALCVAAAAVAAIFWIGESHSVTSEGDVDSLAVVNGEKTSANYYAVEGVERTLVTFDPNTADSTTLLGLGLQPWQVRNIYRYRAKGGVFREPADFARVYGLTAGQYRELEPYIRISPDYRPAAEVYGRHRSSSNYHGGGGYKDYDRPSYSSSREGEGKADRPVSRDTLRYPVKLAVGEHIDINLADTTMLKKVPGIGSYYARKVVAYRERLGGFFSVDQLFEINGFPEESVDFMMVGKAATRHMNVNKLTLSQLRQHPYINFYQAKAITDYRRLKGPLRSLEQLALLPEFTPETIERLKPYVEF